MSLHTRWAEAIYRGDKAYEFRRGAPRMSAGDHVLIYETAPRRQVSGHFTVKRVIELPAHELMMLEDDERARTHIAQYLDGAARCCAFEIENVERYEKPLLLADVGLSRGPMSYQRLRPALDQRLSPRRLAHVNDAGKLSR